MNLLKPSFTKRLIFFLIVDFFIFSFSLYSGLLFRFNFSIPAVYTKRWLYWFLFVDIFKIAILWIADIYKLNWRFVSLNEFYKIAKSLFFTFLVLYFVNVGMQKFGFNYAMPRSAIIIDFLVSLLLILIVRSSRRVYVEIINPPKMQKTKRTLIIGAGDSGERIARELRMGKNEYQPVVFVDDDKSKIGTIIQQIKVEGSLDDIERLVEKYSITTSIIAITTLHHSKIKELFDRLNNAGIKDIKIVPSIDKLPSNNVSIKDLKDISIEDLLAREIVEIDIQDIRDLISNKVVMVTGAGGSIGSEITRQLLKFSPKTIIGYEIDETELHLLGLELNDKRFYPIIGDIKDKEKLEFVISKYKPSVIFHAAAYKHVPMMEYFPEEAVKVNILGTKNLVEAAVKYNIEKFVNISTDKAVKPKNIMGATKSIVESICRAYDKEYATKFISVRFGNVLGSRGSAIPLFIEQIKKGGPVTVTHPDMKRYFMSIPEAVLLVFQAASMGNGGEVFVLDMGKPIKIVDLVERLIKLEGFEPYKDIEVKFTGIRPGEKLFEELLTTEEGAMKTRHSKIFAAKISNTLSIEDIDKFMHDLRKTLRSHSKELIKDKIKNIPV